MVSKIDDELMVAIDKRYTDELHNIYQTHKLGTQVQRLRKNTNLNPWNKIFINFECSCKVQEIINSLKNTMVSRLQSDITVNQVIDKEKYASSTYEYEFFDDTKEEINFSIYLM